MNEDPDGYGEKKGGGELFPQMENIQQADQEVEGDNTKQRPERCGLLTDKEGHFDTDKTDPEKRSYKEEGAPSGIALQGEAAKVLKQEEVAGALFDECGSEDGRKLSEARCGSRVDQGATNV
jgi:hypothetical protein